MVESVPGSPLESDGLTSTPHHHDKEDESHHLASFIAQDPTLSDREAHTQEEGERERDLLEGTRKRRLPLDIERSGKRSRETLAIETLATGAQEERTRLTQDLRGEERNEGENISGGIRKRNRKVASEVLTLLQRNSRMQLREATAKVARANGLTRCNVTSIYYRHRCQVEEFGKTHHKCLLSEKQERILLFTILAYSLVPLTLHSQQIVKMVCTVIDF